jgi:ribokinase
MTDVVTLGDINVDVLARVPHYPALGGDTLAERVSIRGGGSAANTAVVLSKFGLDVSLLARVGRDVLGDYALSDLRQGGVNIFSVQRDNESITGLVFAAVTPDGERTFFSCRGANARLVLDWEGAGVVQEAKILHVSGYALVESPQRDSAAKATEVARRFGVPVTVDLGVEVTTMVRENVLEMLSGFSMVIANRAVAQWLTGKGSAQESVEALLAQGPETVGLKLGEQGCLIGSAKGVFGVPAFEVEPLDDTGAGDSFNAGLILGRIAGLGLRESALLANALGALATTVTGAGSSLPGPNEAIDFLEERRGGSAWQGWSEELRRISEYLTAVEPLRGSGCGLE